MKLVSRFKKTLFTCLAFTLVTILSAQTKDWKVTPEKIFVFEISEKQIEQLLWKEYYTISIDTILTEPITWFPKGKEWIEKPEKGHFIYADINRNKVYFNYAPAIPFQVFIFQEYGAFTLQVIDQENRVREDAIVTIKELKEEDGEDDEKQEIILRVPYNADTHTYSIRENSRKEARMLLVELDGYTSFFRLDKHLVNRWYQEYNRTKRSKEKPYKPSFYRYTITDKNKYKPGETVRFKTYALNGNKQPLKKELSVWLQGFDGRYKQITTIQPNHPGNYTGEIFLHDSLELKLDRSYNIQLRDAGSAIIGSTSFRYEDYELLDAKLDVRLKTIKHFTPENNEVIIHATDANGLTLPEATAEITIVCTNVSSVFSDYIAIPNQVFHETIRLESMEPTHVPIPAYLFGNSNCSYRVDVSVKTLDSQPLHQSYNVEFYHDHHELIYYVKDDKICFDMLELGNSKPAKAFLKYDSGKKRHEITLPYEEKMDLKHHTYIIEIPGFGIEQRVLTRWFAPGFELSGHFSEGAFHTKLENPLDVEFSWYIYAGEKLIRKGAGKELDITIPKTDLGATHYVELFYRIENSDEIFTRSFTPMKEYLDITTNLPSRIYPGQTWETLVQVKDIHGKPLKGVDLTAFSVNSLLNYSVPNLPYYGNPTRARTQKDDYDISNWDFSTSLAVSWPYWKKHAGLDSMQYYHFIFPHDTLFRYVEPTPDSITQFAPYVMKDGAAVNIYVIECDDEPVYFSWTHNIQGYSFPANPDTTQTITLRLHDCAITLPALQFTKGEKTTLSIDLDHLPENVIRNNMYTGYKRESGEFTNQEKEKYKKYISRIPASRQQFTYLKYGDHIYPVHYRSQHSSASGNYLTGPYPPVLTNWMDGVTYRHEGGYRYEYEGNVVYKYYETNQLPGPLQFTSDSYVNKLHDFHISLDSIYRFLERDTIQKPVIYTQPSYYRIVQNGMNLNLQLNAKQVPSPIAGVVLYNPANDSVITQRNNKAYAERYFSSNPDGMYDIVLLYYDGSYLRAENIPLIPNNYISVNMRQLSLQDRDEASAQWLELFPTLNNNVVDITPGSQTGTQTYRRPSHSNNNMSNSPRYVSGERYSTPQKIYGEGTKQYTTHGSNITGEVLDEYGEPLIGTSILIKGTITGTIADIDGKFNLRLPAENSGQTYVLLFNFIGYKQVEVNVRPGTYVQVIMQEETNTIDEVVVVGYGTQKKSSISGAVSSVTGEKVTKSKPSGLQETVEFEEAGTNEESINSSAAEEQLYEELRMLDGLRSNFSDVGFWEPVLYTDKKGEASFTVTFPDNITKWNAVIYAMNRKLQTGTFRQSINSWKPLMGELKTPQFLVAGDTAYAASTIRNYTKDKEIQGNIVYTLNGDTLQNKPVSFEGLWEQRMLMKSATPDTLTGMFLFTRDDGYKDGEERKIPVIPTGTEIADGALQILKNGEVIDLETAPGEEIFVTFTSRPLEVYMGVVEYLLNYQYACNEQLASKLSGLIQYKLFCQYKEKEFEYDKQVNEIIAKLLQNQNDQQLWSWWGRTTETSVWMSAHILRSLKKAKDAGYTVDLNVSKVQHEYMDIHPDKRGSLRDIDIIHALSGWDIEQDYENLVSWFENEIWEKEKEQREKEKRWRAQNRSYYSRYYSQSYLKEKLLLWEIRQQQGLPYSTDSISKYLHKEILGTIFCDETEEYLRYRSNRLENTLIAYRIVRNDTALTDMKEAMQMYILGTKNSFWNTYHSSNIVSTILPELLAENASSDAQAKVTFTGKENRELTEFPYQTVVSNGEKLRIEKKEGAPLFCSWYRIQRKTEGYDSDAFNIKCAFNQEGKLIAGKPVTLVVEVEVKEENSEYVMIEVPIPAGCSYASKNNYHYNEVHREYFKEKTVIFCQQLPKGEYKFQIELLPRFTGHYHLNPAKVELMYQPVINAMNDMRKVSIGTE